ncbi:septal ring lytic transglycosylase RlpA family protein [Methylophilaceae bacterium]|jgi:rare lipoprotein A|nr:septal ring lytic transglycosylase RlpA family protein [Methylophilaceae bacterium]|tara:strand:- start:4155 stop:4958 length:804 start_codon:yes stop_codon:yes gene_type:complete
MFKFIPIIFIFLLAGCQSILPEKKNESTKKSGGYYLDDGPHRNIPKDLNKIPNAVPKKEILSKTANRPYLVFKKKYTPMTKLETYSETGYASWYGKRYHGNKTSIGEVYDMYQMTGAHKTLPLPCYVKVTNLINEKSVIIRVNDRGPFVKNRIIDLSYAAAHRLEIIEKGSELVRVEVISPHSNSVQYKSLHTFYVQAGAFSDQRNAAKLLNRISKNKIEKKLNKIIKKGSLYSVRLGPYSSRDKANEISKFLSEELSLNTFVIMDK